MRTLRPYQNEALEKFRDMDSAFFAMEMRLGKSLTCLRWLQSKQPKLRVLVLAPKTVLIGWKDELRAEKLPYISLIEHDIATRTSLLERYSAVEHLYHLLNYEAVTRMEAPINTANLDAIVLDESICIKNPQAGVTKVLLKLCDDVRYKACLSGKAMTESWEDLFTQLAFLGGGWCMNRSNFWGWRKYYARCYGYQWHFPPRSVMAIKRYFHERAFSLTRKQAGIGEEKIFQKRVGQLSREERKIYNALEQDWEYEDLSTKYDMVACGWCRRICGGFLGKKELQSWKYKELTKIVCEEMPDEQIVVWFAWVSELRKAESLLRGSGVVVDSLHGAKTVREREKVLGDFQRGSTRVVCVQKDLGRYGLRLDAADTAINFSRTYSLNTEAQSEDRIVRVGKETPLLYIDFITEDTIEEDLVQAVRDKKSNSNVLVARFNDRRVLAKH